MDKNILTTHYWPELCIVPHSKPITEQAWFYDFHMSKSITGAGNGVSFAQMNEQPSGRSI